MKHYLKSLNPIIISKNNENKKTISLLKKNKKKNLHDLIYEKKYYFITFGTLCVWRTLSL